MTEVPRFVPCRLWLAAALVAPGLVAQEQATFYAAYQDGLEAEQAGRWREGAAAFRRAVALRPRPAERVFTYGNNLLTGYHPRLHLARCLVELGELEAAAGQLALAQEEPATEREGLAQRIRDLRPKAPVPPPATPQAQPEPAPAPAMPVPAPETGGSSDSPIPPKAEELRPTALPRPPAAPRLEPTVVAAPPPALPPQPSPELPALPLGPQPLPARALWLGGGVLGLFLLALAWRVRQRLSWRGRGLPGPPPPDSGPAPIQVGPYRLDRRLGRGGFSDTFLAHHRLSGQEVALKLPHPHRADDPEFRGRFRQEARLGALLDHPNLVRILDPGPSEGAPYLAMEYVPGEGLDQHLRTHGALPLLQAVAIARQVAGAMAHAHAHGVVHRDLKPGNILLTEHGVKVMDLGIARVMDAATVTTTYAFLGTPLYAAPEAQLKTHVGPAADRYSLGVILFQMLAGEPPFCGETPFEILDHHRSTLPPDLAALRPDTPEPLARLVARLLDKEADQRPEDAEVCRVLVELEADLSVPAAAPPQD